jgi:hypothetical protein
MEPLFQIRSLIIVSIICSLLIIGAFVCTLNGQIIDRQSFTQSSGFLLMKPSYLMQLDWQLDLGITSIALNQSPNHFYTAGFIQPNIYRHQAHNKPVDFDPNIFIQYNEKSGSIVLLSNESDLIIYGFQVYNFVGAKILSIKTKIASSRLFLSTPLSSLASGVYFIQVYYLPENISSDFQFWIKTQKIIKQ